MILAGFAAIVGVVTTRQVRGEFYNQVNAEATALKSRLGGLRVGPTGGLNCDDVLQLDDYASSEDAQIRIYDLGDGRLACAQGQTLSKTSPAPSPSFPPPANTGVFDELGYRVNVQTIRVKPAGDFALLYARPYSDTDHTLAKVRVFLILGVLGGTIFALLAGLATAGRAMRPISELSDAAREIERTRDPSRHIPHPEAEDEIADLARTLEGMLGALDDARGETESMLERQREFVADASHELRTPLTSVLANLELLADELDGEQAESAKAALRSTRRMRRLVGDLLLLARADAKREQRSRPTDLREVLLEAAAELGPVTDAHAVVIDAGAAPVDGVRDDLHRMTLNLLENAVRHTPPGTEIRAATYTRDGSAVLVVEDHGPGIPPELAVRVFERFVRGGGDGGRGSGLGLAIVRAVAESHRGVVALEATDPADLLWPGTRFTITLPAAGADLALPDEADQTSTTTGSTIGRRRSRS
ncbi:MAG TPA: HAMP domain-containing sensor histidine kinase [Solirubrobacteraceae bacterium]|nr:HAMP domain-containing sensor histidine kinase [Solirubrobacteraceae bacterium]